MKQQILTLIHSVFIIFTTMSNSSKLITSVFLITLLFQVGCKKKNLVSLSIEFLSVEKGSYLKSVYFINDSIGFTCGGKRDDEGYIFKTTDGGVSWVKTTPFKPSCMYAIHFINDTIGFAGGDFLYLLTTTDGGDNWTHYPYGSDDLPFHEQNRPAIKDFSFNSNGIGYFVGGENYNKGVIYRTLDYGLTWVFDTLQQEIFSVYTTVNLSWSAGFGYIGKTNTGSRFAQQSLTNDVFTGIVELNDNSIIAISHTGGIYKSTDSGSSWISIHKKKGVFSKSVSYNAISFQGRKGVIIADNTILISEDYGYEWKEVDFTSYDKLTSISSLNNSIFVTTEGGDLLKFEF